MRLDLGRQRKSFVWSVPPNRWTATFSSKCAAEGQAVNQRRQSSVVWKSVPQSGRADGAHEGGPQRPVAEGRSDIRVHAKWGHNSSVKVPHEISALLARVDATERAVLLTRFGLDRGEPRAMQETADELALDLAEAARLEATGLAKLRTER